MTFIFGNNRRKLFYLAVIIFLLSILAISIKLIYFNSTSEKSGVDSTLLDTENSNKDRIPLEPYETVNELNIFNREVTISIADAHLDTILLNGELINNDYIVSTEGEYTVIATDKAGNSSTSEFEIDLTNPNVDTTGTLLNGFYKGEVTLTASDKNYLNMSIVGGEYLNVTTLTGTSLTVSTSGVYTYTAYDLAGNTTIVNFEIDNNNPEISGVIDGGEYTSGVVINGNDKNFDRLEVNGVVVSNSYPITEDGNYTVIAYDMVGNTSTLSFSVDMTPPLINGVEDGASYNENVTISVSDLNLNEATISSSAIGTVSLANGEEFVVSEDGNYTILASDTFGNTVNLLFKMDQTGLTLDTIVDGEIYGKDIEINIDDPEWASTTLNGVEIGRNYIISEENIKHTIVITDIYGNKTTISNFEIDKTPPVVNKSLIDEEIASKLGDILYGNELQVEVSDRNLSTILLKRTYKDEFGNNITEERIIDEFSTVLETGNYQLIASDVVDNITIINFEIDLIAPVIQNLDEDYYSNEIIISVIDKNFENIFIEGVIILDDEVQTLDKTEVSNGYLLENEGIYTVYAVDKAGNTTVKEVSIDRTPPIIHDIVDNGYYNNNLTLNIIEQNLDTLTIKRGDIVEETFNGTVLSENGFYEITVTDKVGFITKIKFTIDTINPEILDVEEGKFYNENVIINVEDLNLSTITLNGLDVQNEYIVSVDGIFQIIATDLANNGSSIQFIVDKTKPKISMVDINQNRVLNNQVVDVAVIVTASDTYFEKLLYSTDLGKSWSETTESTITFEYQGVYQIKAIDKAGNESTLTYFKIDNDKSKPVDPFIFLFIPLGIITAYLTYLNIKRYFTI